jgi:hypothetical protein
MKRVWCWLTGHLWRYQRSNNLSVQYYYVCDRCHSRYAIPWV